MTLQNVGGSPLTISNVYLANGQTSDYVVSTNCVAPLAPTYSCTLSVEFTPTGPGTRTATLEISDSTNNSPQSVSLIGTGLRPDYGTPLGFVPVTACRIADTRNATDPFGGPFLIANSTRDFVIPSSSCNIPATAAAYSLNVTVVPHQGLSFLTVYPTSSAIPAVSTLNSDGRVKAVAAIIPAGTNGAVSVFTTDDTEMILDINGYFEADSANTLLFNTVTPCRIADTRGASGTFGGPGLEATQTRDFPILASACTVPSAAEVYSLNFTVVPQGTGIGYLSTWSTGQTKPLVSTLNDPTATVLANAAIVPAGPLGVINVYSSDKTDVVMDINGYFAPPADGGLHFYPLSACRALDTRTTGSGNPLNGTISIPLTFCNVPNTAAAVVVNATVVPQGWLGYLSLWPTDTAPPLVSTLNADDGAIASNMAIVPLNNGSINAYSSNPTHLIIDVSGFFAP